MNDIVRCSDKLKFIMYADDTSTRVSSPRLESILPPIEHINFFNGQLVKARNWLASNSLTLNVNKCYYVTFRRRKKQSRDNVNMDLINNQSLMQQSSTKFLGVVFGERLCFSEHVDHVVKKIPKFVPIIYPSRRDMNLYSLSAIYNTLILSCLYYCNSVWGAIYKENLNTLQVLQKRIIRAISYKNISYPPVLKSLKNYFCLIYGRWMGSTAWHELPPDIRHLQQFQAAFKWKLNTFLIEIVE